MTDKTTENHTARCSPGLLIAALGIGLGLPASRAAEGESSSDSTSTGWIANPELVRRLSDSGAVRNGETTYEESKVPDYTLPDPLVNGDGGKVADAGAWPDRRAEILELFKREMYGRAPIERPKEMSFDVFETDRLAMGGKATRKQVRINFTGDKKKGPGMDLLIYLPNQIKHPAPVFLSIEFHDNHTLHADPAIKLNDGYSRAKGKPASEKDMKRGWRTEMYPIEKILARGYGFATFCYGDVAPDHREGFQSGVYAAFDKQSGDGNRPGDAWGALAAWAWGASRAMDYLEGDDDIDPKRVAVQGLSRLGKTALWAGVRDPRFAMAVSSCSGCGGAALSRRHYGETVKLLNQADRFDYWTCGNFKKYDDKEDQLPFDQHLLVALMAPRLVYVSSADEDLWADPRGEFLSCRHGSPAYRLLGLTGLGTDRMPAINKPVHEGRVGYHIRTGGHGVNEYDWQHYMDFADKRMRREDAGS